MQKLKVIIVDSDQANCFKAESFLNGNDFDVVGIANNGVECVEMLNNTNVDIVLTELMLPAMDGYMLIDYINSNAVANKPKVFVMTNTMSDTLLTAALEKGVIYYFIKPLDYNVVKRVMLEKYADIPLWNKLNGKARINIANNKMQALDEKISKIFISIGIPAHIKGYQYLRYAIKQVMDEPTLINNITKKLYPLVAEKFDSSPSKVERAIRHSIDVAWSRGKIENINKLFGFKVYNVNDKPTNGEFVALVADKLLHDLSEDKWDLYNKNHLTD